MTEEYQKFALILGCNYYGSHKLYGCINDALNIRKFLMERRAFEEDSITTLFDKQMTYKNIWSSLEDLIVKSQIVVKQGKIPAIFLYYSGHGTRLDDVGEGEGDNRDGNEALIPYDFASAGYIIDDDLNRKFLARLPISTEIFIFTDCCNSGTNFDLPYLISATRSMDRTVIADVVSLAGCQDSQTSAELGGEGVATGKFLSVIDKVTTPKELAVKMADVSIWSHRQNPQVSTSNTELITKPLFHWLRYLTKDCVESKEFKKFKKRAVISNFFNNIFSFGRK